MSDPKENAAFDACVKAQVAEMNATYGSKALPFLDPVTNGFIEGVSQIYREGVAKENCKDSIQR